MNWLSYAVEIAKNIDPHQVSPNPRVGCVIISNGKKIAEGIHAQFGDKHAEAIAIENIPDLSNCEIYITLEPCDSFEGKKTPSCTDLLIKKNAKKIIIGALDPKFKGKNLKKLRKAGIEVVLKKDKDCQMLNPFFEHFFENKIPYLTLKIAQSLDGKIQSEQKYITNEMSRNKVHEMRANYSAILTTTETILQDNPLLNCRIKNFHRDFSDPIIIIIGKRSLPKNSNILKIPNRKIHFFLSHDLKKVLKECGEMGIDSIMTECGQKLNTELLKQNLVNEIQLFFAPNVYQKQKKTIFNTSLDLKKFQLKNTQQLGNDFNICLKKL